MQIATLSQIYTYPIKSTAGIQLSNSWVDNLGLSFDRRFILTDVNGKFITARTEPKLTLIQASIIENGLIITAPNMPTLLIKYDDFSNKYQSVTVWSDNIQGQHCQLEYDRWFSQYLSNPCQLMFFGQQSARNVKNKSNQVAYADGYPLLLISEASLAQLNRHCSSDITMQQFRPNIVVKNCEAFDEDGWQLIRIGEVEFEIAKPCSRCIFTTLDPKTGEFNKHREPLKTLAQFRKGNDGEIYFGQNLIPLNTGQIKVGDETTLIKRQAKQFYVSTLVKNSSVKNNISAQQSSEPLTKISPETSEKERKEAMNKKINIVFDSWNKTYQGNTKNTVLEQGEAAGLIMRYSCRGGSCGSCKVKLESGEVEQLSNDGLTTSETQSGYILACSCIPKSDLVISKG